MRSFRHFMAWKVASVVTFLGLIGTSWAQEGGEEAGEELARHSPLPEMDAIVTDILTIDIAAIPIWRIVMASLVLMVGIMLRTTVLDWILTPLLRFARRTRTVVDDQLLEGSRRPLGWLSNLIAVYFAVLLLQVPPTLHETIVLILQTMGTVFVAWLIFNVVDALGAYLQELAARTESQIDDHIVPLVKRVLRLLVVIVTVITIIQQWGYDVTSLIAGLGLGGLAFALAAQSTLSNWFGSVMILTDRPFKVGDLIGSKLGGGTIVDVGLRSTKIWTFKGTLITVPNADLAATAVENYNEKHIMNVQANIQLLVSTPREKLERVIVSLRQLLEQEEGVDHERSLVCFNGFGESSLDILLHCFIETDSWATWYERRGRLLLEVLRVLEEEGAEFAYPSQSIYFETPLDVEQGQGALLKGRSEIGAEPAL